MSYEINFQVGVKSSPEEVNQTLTEVNRLAQWWTSDTRGDGTGVGETLEFWFPGCMCEKFTVTALQPGKRVAWRAPRGQGAPDWEDTEVTFDLSQDDKQTYIRFRHSGW